MRALRPIREARGVPRAMLFAGFAIVAVFVILAVFAPLIAPYDFDQFSSDGVRFERQERPSADHLLGTTVRAEDVLSRVIYGSRTALEVVVLAVAFALLVGVPLGLFSGYIGGKLDRALVLVMDALFAFPYLLLAIVVAFLLSDSIGRGVMTAALAITVTYVPQYFRVVRNHVISVREEPYVEAARALGAKRRTIIGRYVFSNVIQNVPPIATLNAADAILTLAALGFLGYGIQPTEAAEWGYDLQRAIEDAGAGIWWTGLFPGLAIVLLVTGFTLVGEGLNDVLNPVIRQRRIAKPTIPAPAGAGAPAAGADRAPAAADGGERRQGAVTDEPVLSARDLRVWYGTPGDPVRAVDGVSLDLRAGETLGLVGESGCGKSTLGRALLGLIGENAAAAGEIRYRGRNLLEASKRELRSLRGPELGVIFQEPMTRLNPLLTIENHFLEALRAHEPRLGRTEMRRRSLEALAGMGIPPTRFRQYPHEFSGGMRQRIMIALALVLRPRVLVADEPTTALDVIVEAQILGILADLRRNFDTALLLITHNLGIVAEACDRVAVMYAGQIVEEGDADEVLTEPAHPYSRELLRSIISLSTTGLHYIPGAPPDLVHPPPACRFHPRCPDAMRVCATKDPIEVAAGRTQRVSCWLHGPDEEVPQGGGEPLEREQIAAAEEA